MTINLVVLLSLDIRSEWKNIFIQPTDFGLGSQLRPCTPPNDNRDQDHTEQQQTGLFARRRVLKHEHEQRREVGARCASGTHIDRGAMYRLARAE